MHHIFNTNFEWELANDPSVDLEHSFTKIQKKFLPLAKLIAHPNDTVFPEKPLPHQIIQSWAPSKLVLRYAKKHNLSYTIPPWETVRKIQSKAFAHTLSPLPNSSILYNSKDLDQWLHKNPPPYVFKSLYGFSGTGHRFRPDNLSFPVLAEPWVNRSFDFSTQWIVKDHLLHYLGATLLISDERGKYKESRVSTDEKALFGPYFPFLQSHIAFVKNQSHHFENFFGNIGIDAFIYDNCLQPICEVNARKTFGWFALQLLLKHPTESNLSLSFSKSGISIRY